MVKHAGLRKLLGFGPNFRDVVPGASALGAVEEGLDDFISRHENPSRPATMFLDWKREVLSRCSEKLKVDNRVPANPRLDLKAKLELRRLQRHFVFVPIDKAGNNFAVVCKPFYCHVLRKELGTDNGAYERVYTEDSALIKTHQQFLVPKHLFHKKSGLPFFYWMPKFHKTPVGTRFIAASSQCTTATLSKALSHCLTHVMRTQRDKDNQTILSTGIRRFFVVETYRAFFCSNEPLYS